MFIRSSVLAACLAAASALAQTGEPLDPASALRFQLAPDSPLAVLATNLGDSRVETRGGAMVLDLRATLTLRNNSPKSVRGVTLLVLAQELTAGGKGSVAVPSLNVAPGASFPVRVNLRLLRPLPAPVGPLVQLGLDGVLFSDFSFFGPNRLESRRTMVVWEMEAQRDRQHFQAALAANGPEGLRQQILASLARQQSRPRLEAQVNRAPTRALSAAVSALTGKSVQLAVLKLPEAPLELVSASSHVSGGEAHSPHIEYSNRSGRPVRHVEVGWLVRDAGGREYLAGSVPASAAPDGVYRFFQGREPLEGISGMRGFLSQVEFSDGSVWIPARRALADQGLLGLLPVSPEEQRLSELYRTRGLQALVEELARFLR